MVLVRVMNTVHRHSGRQLSMEPNGFSNNNMIPMAIEFERIITSGFITRWEDMRKLK